MKQQIRVHGNETVHKLFDHLVFPEGEMVITFESKENQPITFKQDPGAEFSEFYQEVLEEAERLKAEGMTKEQAGQELLEMQKMINKKLSEKE